MTALDVYFHADLAGRLERLPQARLRFTYDPAWVQSAGAPLSLGLPVREDGYDDFECAPFFAGLLPEGEFLKAIARAFGVSAGNAFSVLAEIGGECAGAVSLVSPGETPPFAAPTSPSWLAEAELGELLAELPKRPLLIGLDDEDEGIRLSLAGARDKLPVIARDSQLGITRGHPPSTHIVKAPIVDVEGMVVNEAFCMTFASELGLDAAEALPIRVGDHEALLVTRYDRVRDGESVHRIHQEDLCQALSCMPGQKYESEGGPGVAPCAELLRVHSTAPAVDLLAFFDALIFNLLIGNADAHSKNYSLMLEGDRAPRLAPLYDLLSTRVYGRRFGRKMAMKYGGEYRFDKIRGRHLDRLAGEVGIAPGLARQRAETLASRIRESCEAARERLPEGWRDAPILAAIEDVIADAAD
ncbi:MAG: type II toxin-antitoxin system HipA family toxin, partial [Chloroflexota bacterium]